MGLDARCAGKCQSGEALVVPSGMCLGLSKARGAKSENFRRGKQISKIISKFSIICIKCGSLYVHQGDFIIGELWAKCRALSFGEAVLASASGRRQRKQVTMTATPDLTGFVVAWSSWQQDVDGQ